MSLAKASTAPHEIGRLLGWFRSSHFSAISGVTSMTETLSGVPSSPPERLRTGAAEGSSTFGGSNATGLGLRRCFIEPSEDSDRVAGEREHQSENRRHEKNAPEFGEGGRSNRVEKRAENGAEHRNEGVHVPSWGGEAAASGSFFGVRSEMRLPSSAAPGGAGGAAGGNASSIPISPLLIAAPSPMSTSSSSSPMSSGPLISSFGHTRSSGTPIFCSRSSTWARRVASDFASPTATSLTFAYT